MTEDDNIGVSYAEMSFEEEWADHGEDNVTEDKSDLMRALLEIRIRIDMFEDLLAQELHQIRDLVEEDQPTTACGRLENLIRILESDGD